MGSLRCASHPSPSATAVTPLMVKAAWSVARRWWPYKVVEVEKKFVVKETAINVAEPMPGFREAIQAALDAMPASHAMGADGEAGSEP